MRLTDNDDCTLPVPSEHTCPAAIHSFDNLDFKCRCCYECVEECKLNSAWDRLTNGIDDV